MTSMLIQGAQGIFTGLTGDAMRAPKGASAVTVAPVVRWAAVNGARVLGLEDGGVIAPGKLADLAIFDLSHPRYFGPHDPLIGPVVSAGDAHLRHLIVGGCVVVSDDTIPGIDLAQLRHDAAIYGGK